MTLIDVCLFTMLVCVTFLVISFTALSVIALSSAFLELLSDNRHWWKRLRGG